jgi:hypothetical protein
MKTINPGNVIKAASNHARAVVPGEAARRIVIWRRLERRADGALQKS